MYEHFKGEETFVKKMLEYIDQVQDKQRCICTKFLNPYHQSIVTSLLGKRSDIQVVMDGGILEAENKKVILCPDYFVIEPEDFQLGVIKIKYAKHFETLKHSDVLGALMALGLKRELFGDIVEYQEDFYVAIDVGSYAYLEANLQQIKRSKVKISLTTDSIEHVQEYTMRQAILSSMRLDKVVSSFYKIPRSKACQYIGAGHVKVNHKVVEGINYLCNNNDVISLKKHGRVKICTTGRITKSDNQVVEGYFYK